MISANRIVFRGVSSQNFDLKTCLAFDSDSGETDSFLTREAVASESYRGEFNRIHNFKYTEVFSPQFTLMKKDFSNFTLEEERRVLKWLTGSSNASFLSVYYDDSEVISWEVLGGFTNISLYKLGNGRTVGITATFEASTPYALSPLKTVTITGVGQQEIDINTDEPESPIYPRITIQQDSSVIIPITEQLSADKLIEGTLYKNNNKYYWLSSKWTGSAIISFFTSNTSTAKSSYDIETDADYDTEENATQAIEAKCVRTLLEKWSGEGLSDEQWNTIQWKVVDDKLIGNFYKQATTYSATEEYYIQAEFFSGSSLYKKMNKNNYTINNLEKNGIAYRRTKVATEAVFQQEQSKLYVKDVSSVHPQIEISMSTKTNIVHNQELSDEAASKLTDTTSVVLVNTYIDNNGNIKEQVVEVKNNQANENIILDGANQMTSSVTYPYRIFGDDFTWNWLYLVDGQNTIGVIGNCTVILEWREPIKCGEF